MLRVELRLVEIILEVGLRGYVIHTHYSHDIGLSLAVREGKACGWSGIYVQYCLWARLDSQKCTVVPR